MLLSTLLLTASAGFANADATASLELTLPQSLQAATEKVLSSGFSNSLRRASPSGPGKGRGRGRGPGRRGGPGGGPGGGPTFDGAVYAMSNDFTANSIVAYGRGTNGMLTFVGEFATSGQGAMFDGGEGLDPLISAYAVLLTPDNEFLMAVNAGSNSLTVFRVNSDMTLTITDVANTGGVGPNSIAYSNGLVYVSNIDADGVFAGEPDQEGSLMGFQLNRAGVLTAIPGSTRVLDNRPSGIQFSPSGGHLVVTSINAGSSALASGSIDEVVVYSVSRSGRLSFGIVGAAASTLPFNRENRNLASAIGFEVVEQGGQEFVVVTEAREFQADGSPPTFPNLQTGSVSVWRLLGSGALAPLQLDVLAGNTIFDGELTTCWIEFSANQDYFWTSNAIPASLSSYAFNANGTVSLLNATEAVGTPGVPSDPFGTTDGWIDLWASDDGRFIYQLYGLAGIIGVFETSGPNLTLIQEVSGQLPTSNTQGIVAF